MGRLIDADEIEYFPLDEVFNQSVMIAYKKRIDSMPTVELIRCKDCTYYRGDHEYCVNDMFAVESGFCNWAERKEE